MWGLTGDIGCVTPDGQIIIKCRAKERFTNENNESCFPYLIEDVLTSQDEVRRCKIVSTTYDGKPVMAVHIILNSDVPDKGLFARKLQSLLRENDEIRLFPKLYKFRDMFPINTAGKTDLPKIAAETDDFFVMPDESR